jgi:hypothetical protein
MKLLFSVIIAFSIAALAQQPASDRALPTVTSGDVNAAAPTKEAPSYDPTQDRAYRAYLWATILGVVGGFLGVGVLIWQTVLTRRSANAARDAASAAKISAEAVINSERPWLFISIKTTERAPNAGWHS